MFTAGIQVDLFGTVCNTGAADADGCVWSVSAVEGWDGPDQRTRFDNPTGSHGSYGSEFYAQGRALTVTGLVVAATQDGAWAGYQRAVSAMPGLLGSGDVVVYEPTPKSLTVRQAAPPLVDQPNGGMFRFQLKVLAEYPWKRALTAVDTPIAAGGSANIANSGTFAAELKITTTGAGVVKVGAYGATLGTSASLPSGSVLSSIDRTIVDNTGADRYSLIATDSQWLAAPVGSTTFTNTGTAPVVVSHYPTYA